MLERKDVAVARNGAVRVKKGGSYQSLGWVERLNRYAWRTVPPTRTEPYREDAIAALIARWNAENPDRA